MSASVELCGVKDEMGAIGCLRHACALPESRGRMGTGGGWEYGQHDRLAAGRSLV